jgi:hypothetical protein
MPDVLDVDDLDALALAVDERIRALPPGCDPARLFGVRIRPRGVVLVPFWSGVAREIPQWLAPPGGVVAIALETGGWAAPMNPDGTVSTRPSRHPKRQRIHHTVIIGGAGEDVSVLRYNDLARDPLVLRDGVGLVLELLLAVWARRPDRS